MQSDFSPVHASPHLRHGSNIGQPHTRRDGILKVTGAARYAADNHPAGMLHAVLAVSSIARGRVSFLDVDAAKAAAKLGEVEKQLAALSGDARVGKARGYVKDQLRKLKLASIEAI